jgi:hypothetical protein
MLYRVHFTKVGFEFTALVMIDTDCICSCKSNYHAITTVHYIDQDKFLSSANLRINMMQGAEHISIMKKMQIILIEFPSTIFCLLTIAINISIVVIVSIFVIISISVIIYVTVLIGIVVIVAIILIRKLNIIWRERICNFVLVHHIVHIFVYGHS